MTHYINQIRNKYCNIVEQCKNFANKTSNPFAGLLKNAVIFLFYTHSINLTYNTSLYEFWKLPINY